jgi:hypothetical protein
MVLRHTGVALTPLLKRKYLSSVCTKYQGTSLKITDFVTGRQFHPLKLHDKFSKRFSVKNQLSHKLTHASHIDLYETMTNQRRYAMRAGKLPKLYA